MKIFLQGQWKIWLKGVVGLKDNTIESYSERYLPRLLDRLKPQVVSLMHQLIANGEFVKLVALLYKILEAWKNQDANWFNKGNDLSQKTIDNYGTALARYIDFLMDLIKNGILPAGPSSSNFVNLPKNASMHYTRDELVKTFSVRLITQDRFPVRGVYFPIRLIKKIILSANGGSRWFELWVKRYARGIRVLAKKEIYRIGEIESLDIFNGRVYVNTKADQVLTETSPNRPNPDEMRASTLADIAINHDVPISLLLAAGGWHALDQLKQMVDNWYATYNPGATSILQGDANDIAQGVYAVIMNLPVAQRQALIYGLKKDLQRIAISPLTLMERGENSRKNDKLA